jgi:hypothetical protein
MVKVMMVVVMVVKMVVMMVISDHWFVVIGMLLIDNGDLNFGGSLY